jgi:two-component system response regulator (stage 0 sporulation protein A)
MGVPVNRLGYHYLRYAIEMLIEDPMLTNSLTTVLYPTIAERCNINSQSVERSIRSVIGIAYDENMDEAEWSRVFGRKVKKDVYRPTNGEFIAAVADYLVNGV